jgi:hypothetical protein
VLVGSCVTIPVVVIATAELASLPVAAGLACAIAAVVLVALARL